MNDKQSSSMLVAALELRPLTLENLFPSVLQGSIHPGLHLFLIDLSLYILPLYLQFQISRRSKGPCLLPLCFLKHVAWDWSPRR